jgi:hypothetical protein
MIRTAALNVFRPALVSVVLSMLACTSVPMREFTSYKQAFADARSAGEQVLFDYGAAVREYQQEKERLAEDLSENSAPAAVENDRTATFGPAAGSADVPQLDDLTVRIGAWDVVQRYNDVLLSLAEGKSTAQISAAVDGLMQSLAAFPLEDVATAVSSISPYMGALREVLTLSEYERSRRKFVAAVKKGAPLIGVPIREPAGSEGKDSFQSFLKLLRDDAKNFYNIRKGLNDLAYDRIVDEAADLRRRFRILILEFKPDDELDKLTTDVNILLKSVSLPPVAFTTEEKDQASQIYTPVVYTQLVQLKDQIGAKVNAARKKTGELKAYKSMAVAYVKLINHVSDSLQALLTAVERDLKTIPPIRELLPVYIELRQAIHIYRDSRGD